jgi:uncharacterized protein YecT (DUF1311 family)
MKKSFLMPIVILFCGLIFAACSSAPTEEINATKAAVAAAQTDDVRDYAPDGLKAAEDEMNKALAEVQTQDGKRPKRKHKSTKTRAKLMLKPQ